MDSVPFVFCDSVVLAVQDQPKERMEEPLLESLQMLAGYWGVAAGRTSNHLSSATLHLQSTDSDNWTYMLSFWTMGPDRTWLKSIRDWRAIREAKRCFVIRTLYVSSCREEKSISTAELRELLSFGYRKPLNVIVGPTKNNRQAANLIENLNVRRIDMDYEPEFERFVINAMASKYLLSATFDTVIPVSLHPHIREWARRDEFLDLEFCRGEDVVIDFPIYERFVRRALRTTGKKWMSLVAKFSEADCERIMTFPGLTGRIYNPTRPGEGWHWQTGGVQVILHCCLCDASYHWEWR